MLEGARAFPAAGGASSARAPVVPVPCSEAGGHAARGAGSPLLSAPPSSIGVRSPCLRDGRQQAGRQAVGPERETRCWPGRRGGKPPLRLVCHLGLPRELPAAWCLPARSQRCLSADRLGLSVGVGGVRPAGSPSPRCPAFRRVPGHRLPFAARGPGPCRRPALFCVSQLSGGYLQGPTELWRAPPG